MIVQGHVDREKSIKWLMGDERLLERIKAIFIKNLPWGVLSVASESGKGSTFTIVLPCGGEEVYR